MCFFFTFFLWVNFKTVTFHAWFFLLRKDSDFSLFFERQWLSFLCVDVSKQFPPEKSCVNIVRAQKYVHNIKKKSLFIPSFSLKNTTSRSQIKSCPEGKLTIISFFFSCANQPQSPLKMAKSLSFLSFFLLIHISFYFHEDCQRWCHLRCQNISKTDRKLWDKPSLMYICLSCRNDNYSFINNKRTTSFTQIRTSVGGGGGGAFGSYRAYTTLRRVIQRHLHRF